MIQLRVYDNSDQFWLDLYEESPIKLTLSVEDITNAEATSTFSRTFRVPNTSNNYYFFKTAFMVDGIDFDVTLKKKAEILVDGQTFKQGHIRLQKVFGNEDMSKVDYEIVFLGETRDFASALGDKPLCQLPLDLTHALDRTNVVNSWQAYPQGLPTAGLFNGDVLYPLIDHGNTYDGGVVQEAEIKTDTTKHAKSFTQFGHPVYPDRFKPMIRAKAIIDAIFAQTPYTYESNFLDSFLFKKLYVSAFGNDTSIYADTTATDNLFEGESTNYLNINSGGVYIVPINQEILDPANNFDNTTYTYTVPVTGSYTFSAQALVDIISDPGTAAYATAELWRNNTVVNVGNSSQFAVALYTTLTLTAGDLITFRVRFSPTTDRGSIGSYASLSVLNAPGTFNPTVNLDCNYKQIDFLKDILTAFRLVIAPVRDDPFKFKIEPWNNYIASGQIFDWSTRLDRNKDVQLEPLFLQQSDRIEFKFSEDEDWLNKYTQDSYKEVYGQLNFESGSELLKGTRDIKTGFAPTPMLQIQGDDATSPWVIPQVHAHDTDENITTHNPIRPKTRLLFYTGLHNTTDDWYFRDGGSTQSYIQWPLVHYQENWPPQANDLNVNWARWFGYYNLEGQLSGYSPFAGQSLYERYWSRYIASLYNKFGRRMTATFILDHLDLVDLTFDDIIFIDGAYWRPEKIVDAPIGERGPVKVQLIKLDAFKPSDRRDPEIWYYYNINLTDCSSQVAGRLVLQSPYPLNIGDIVSVVGSSDCYVVTNNAATTIYDVVLAQTWGTCADCLGSEVETSIYIANRWTDDCTGIEETSLIVDSPGPLNIGDTVQLQNTLGCWYISGISQLAPQDTVDAISPDCDTCQGNPPPTEYYYLGTSCLDGSGTVYTIVSTQANLLGRSVTLPGVIGCVSVEDITGITPGALTPESTYLTCEECEQSNPTNYVLVSCGIDIKTGFPPTVVANNANGCPIPSPGDLVRVFGEPGCWTMEDYTDDPATATLACQSAGLDCVECQTLNPVYRVVNCQTGVTLYVEAYAPLSIGDAVQLVTYTGCYEVAAQTDVYHPQDAVTTVYGNCDICIEQL